MKFSCGKCGQRYKADESFAGEEIECSKCNTLILIPNIEPPQIKINIPEIRKTDTEPASAEKVKVPKLTLPASSNKKSRDNITEKAPSLPVSASSDAGSNSGNALSLNITPPVNEELKQNSHSTPSLGISNQIKERLGQNSGNAPSLGISNQVKERLGQSSANTPSLGMSNQIKERLQA